MQNSDRLCKKKDCLWFERNSWNTAICTRKMYSELDPVFGEEIKK